MSDVCSPLDLIRDVTPNTDGCEEYLQMGDTWDWLRCYVDEVWMEPA